PTPILGIKDAEWLTHGLPPPARRSGSRRISYIDKPTLHLSSARQPEPRDKNPIHRKNSTACKIKAVL
ncbi:MAG: hypothetical protein RSE06_01960, partial [Comamonas sp.]